MNSLQQRVDDTPLSEKTVFLLVHLCFFASGFAALLYQAAWLRKLIVIFGSSYSTVAIVLAAYMGGLALGADLAARLSHKIKRPVLTYGFLEGLIAITACLVPFMLNLAGLLLIALFGGQDNPVAADGIGQSAYYLVATFLILAIPTTAMGATLPLLARYAIHENRQIGPRIGLLYGINTMGAVIGTLIAGFLLLPYLGLLQTLLIGGGINLLVFFLAAYLAQKRHIQNGRTQNAPTQTESAKIAVAQNAQNKESARAADKGGGHRHTLFHWIMPIMLVSGSISFTLEVLWTRLLSHIFGGTIYAFSIMLASFLFGIAAGGLLAGRLALHRQNAAGLFVLSQVLVALLSFLSYSYIDSWLPVFSSLGVKAVYAFLVIVPSTFCIGLTYPLAVRMACENPEQAASVSGQIYAWNTCGAIIGSLLTGFFLLPLVGFEGTIKIAVLISLTLAVLAVFAGFNINIAEKKTALRLLPVLALLLVFVIITPKRPDGLVHANTQRDVIWGKEHFYAVGRSATILMRETQGFITLSSNGLPESSIGRKGMPPFNLSQKWLSGLAALARPDAKSALIIGYGGGVAVEGIPPSIAETDVIELEPQVIAANKSVLPIRGHDPLAGEGVQLIVNDARNAMLLTDKKYDLVISQPSHPWTAGASHLYTKEFIELAKRNLTEDGVFLQWINSQFVDEKLLRILTATITNQFNYVELYQPERHVLMFVASQKPIDIWTGRVGARKALAMSPRHYARMGATAVEDIIAMSLADNEGVRIFAAGQPVNTDNQNYLAFFSRVQAGGLTAEDLADIFRGIDPLTNPHSYFHAQANAWDFSYIAENLLRGNFILRTVQMANATHAPAQKQIISALGYYHSGEKEKAEESFAAALALDEDNEAAQFGLLRIYLGDFAKQSLPEHIAKLANRQSGPIRRVLEGWVFGASAAFDKLQAIDADLARVEKTSLAYPIAVKLRADWRVIAAQRMQNPQLAGQALDLLDDLLASNWNTDLYSLRAAAAYLAGEPYIFVESVATIARQLDARLAFLERKGGAIPTDEANALRGLLRNYADQLDRETDDALLAARALAVKTDLIDIIARL